MSAQQAVTDSSRVLEHLVLLHRPRPAVNAAPHAVYAVRLVCYEACCVCCAAYCVCCEACFLCCEALCVL